MVQIKSYLNLDIHEGSINVMCSVVNSKMSAADTRSELETDTEKRRADRSHEDEKKKRAHSPAMSAYMLKCSKRDW